MGIQSDHVSQDPAFTPPPRPPRKRGRRKIIRLEPGIAIGAEASKPHRRPVRRGYAHSGALPANALWLASGMLRRNRHDARCMCGDCRFMEL